MQDDLPLLDRAGQLLRYLRDELDVEEQSEFLAWLNDHSEQAQFLANLVNEEGMEIELAFMATTGREQAWNDLQQKLQLPKKDNVLQLWKRITIAAAMLIVMGAGMYYYIDRRSVTIQDLAVNDIKAGGNKAYLTLANGKRIVLSDARNGEVAEEAGISITKTANGQLLYEIEENPAGRDVEKVLYNTISTPAGGQYEVVLPDGTHVWLNAASSLKYATSIASLKERRVELSGEAYFEVSKLSYGGVRKPFIVKSNGQEVEVLGTHFNISSYNQEGGTATTLLEGSVKVRRQGVFDETILPGEQALVQRGIRVTKVDTATAVAWKNGLFKFENANIYTVMNQFSRWYNFEVQYEGKAPGNKFNGEIYRSLNASKALKILNYARIRFRVEVNDNDPGKKKIVIINPNP